MSKMRKEYDPNKVKRRKRKPIVYIICEGKETETLYFKHFRSRNCLVDIIPIPSKHKAAEHLVKHAKSLISQADYYPKDGDQLWCVFDCDDNKDSELQAAISYSEKHGYKIAYSNPAFEYWYLLHFEKRNGYLKDSATVIDILKNKGYLENYGKSVDVFEELQEHQPEAIQYAKERVERLTRDQVEKRMAEIAVLRTHIVNYAKTREAYVAYRKAGYSKKFLEEHEEEILLHQAAKNAFDEMGVKKLPKVKELQTEYAKLLEEKKKTYAKYRRSREEMRELLTAKANVDRVLKMEVEQDVEKEKDHGQR